MNKKIIDDAIESAAQEGRAPEQQDFITAAFRNRDLLSEEEQKALQADLRAAELGTSTESLYSSQIFDDEYVEEYWDELEYEEALIEDEPDIKYYIVACQCPNDWLTWNYWVSEGELIDVKSKMCKNHHEECGCSGTLTFFEEEHNSEEESDF